MVNFFGVAVGWCVLPEPPSPAPRTYARCAACRVHDAGCGHLTLTLALSNPNPNPAGATQCWLRPSVQRTSVRRAPAS